MKKIRKFLRSCALFLVVNLLVQLGMPTVSWALTGGPNQPETQQFSPAGMNNMVDPFTGDFSYNIPLMDVGGYPVNLNYAAGITPDDEASWVGLGWNLNVGAVNRNVRGLPDDFSGDEVVTDFNVKPNQTYGVSGKLDLELYGYKLKALKLGLSTNFFYNNYNGFGMSMGVSPSVSAGLNSKNTYTGSLGLSSTLSSESGLEVTPNLGIKSVQSGKNNGATLQTSVGFPFSTREGLKGMTLSGSFGTSYKALKGYGTGTYQGFAYPTITPTIEHNTYNINASLNMTFEMSNPASEIPTFGFGGYYSGQFLKNTSRPAPSYGYMYSGISSSEDKILDFNREKDGGFNKFTTNLAVTNFTYDIFNVSGQGTSGTFRLHRGDVGAVHDPYSSDQGYSPSLGIGFAVGVPPSSKVAVDAMFNYTSSFSGKWPDNRGAISSFANENNFGIDNPNIEPVYFKKIGEASPEANRTFLDQVQQGNSVLQHSISPGGGGYLNGYYSKLDGSTVAVPSNNLRATRRDKTTPFTTLNGVEASSSAIRPIENYKMNDFDWFIKEATNRSPGKIETKKGYSKNGDINRVEGPRKAHHISEIRVTDPSGARYIYGIPVYNTKQEEVSFAIKAGNGDKETGLASYESGKDDTDGNSNGIDHYYNKVSTPPYSTSNLLTCILSSDYVDSDGIDGPTDGDLGSYTKFNYTRLTDNYKWRTPYEKASFTDGMVRTTEDDKANYLYGEKEIWYLHSIETRTHVAEFYLKDRKDGYGVSGNGGGLGGTALKCLDKIVLHSKADKWNSKAEPLKTVYFQYSYSLCKGIPNNIDNFNTAIKQGGKLTLDKVWFTYGNSLKGALNPYVFKYADRDFDGQIDSELNPDYAIKNYDRWGNYKPDNSNGWKNAEFPYALQEKITADKYAGVYALSTIQTPTGGTMRVYYESDDYAYVQNKQAMRMFKVIGASENNSIPDDNNKGTLYDAITLDDTDNKMVLIIDLGEGFVPTSTNAQAEFKQKYLAGIDLMYYKFLLKVIDGEPEEYVPGYAEIDIASSELLDAGKVVSGTETRYTRAAIRLKTVKMNRGKGLGEADMNPIVRNGWMFARLHLNREMMGSGNSTDNGLEQAIRAMLAMSTETIKMFTGFAAYMAGKLHSSTFKPDHSFVRLNEPDKIKQGGGHRVKAIVMVDNWKSMLGDKETGNTKQTSYYGQTYDYSYVENGTTISAGVAAYEPILGNEENPFRLPVFVREKVPLAPAKEYFLEEPFGESFFPSPTVGYRKVVVKPLKITTDVLNLNNLVGNGTGKVEHEFYTSYDFPTQTQRTAIKMDRHKPNILFKFMKFDCKDLVTCSQGYYVELNDMHGKQKSQRVYPDSYKDPITNVVSNPDPISEVEYYYKQEANGTLRNTVPYVSKDLTYSESDAAAPLGVDVDVVQDERFFQTTTLGGGIQLNIKWTQYAIIPTIVPTGFPDFTNEQTRFRSVVTTKVMHRTGILERTVAKDNGAAITTKNLGWDKRTGGVLLTSVENEFHQPVYNFTYPGYWAYERMKLASEREGATYTGIGSLKDGDEVYVETSVGGNVQYYMAFYDGELSKLILKNGSDVPGTVSKVKVIRSGARNAASTPVGNISCLKNPIPTSGGTLSFENVLNAAATEFKDKWLRYCNCPIGEGATTTNPFALGLRGNLRPLRSSTFLTDRSQTQLNNNLAIRKDGYMIGFVPFWQIGTEFLQKTNSLKWQYVTEIQNYNSVGMEIENKDALQRYSMAQFGYGRNLAVATSNNSRYRSTGYDGFEDYEYLDCQDDHFSWRTFKANLSNEESHTGNKSIKVPKNGNVKIRKVIVDCP